MNDTLAPLEPKKLSKKQKIALTYLAKGYVPRRVAKMVNIKLATLNSWMADHEMFRTKLESRLSDYEDTGATYRKRNNIHFLEKINEEIHRKIKRGDLTDEDLKSLVALKSRVEGDIRADTPKVLDPSQNSNQQFNFQIMINQLKERYEGTTSKDFVDIKAEAIDAEN